MKDLDLNSFRPISLEEMDGVALLKRTDTKFILHRRDLILLLQRLTPHYEILEINQHRLMAYNSLYFDTPDYKFYLNHHNRRLNRTKIRMRKYIESDLSFLEIKQKNNLGILQKSRIKIHDLDENMSIQNQEYIQKVTGKNFELKPAISNSFKRFTLVNTLIKERVTIDLILAYNNEVIHPNLVVIELKQEKFDRNSMLVRTLSEMKIKPFSISKYCIGMAIYMPSLKQNLFKRKLATINKL